MDTIIFIIETRDNNLNDTVAIPLVNGRSVIDLIKEVEMNYDVSIAGAYDGIRPDLLFDELTNGSTHDSTKSKVLECDCGVDGCWSLLVKVSQGDETVSWSQFSQMHRDNWDYSILGEFVFSKDEYLTALNTLKA